MIDYNLLLAMGTDATTWAQEFKLAVEADPRTLEDEAVVAVWFANAIEAGEDDGYDRGVSQHTHDWDDGYEAGMEAASIAAAERDE